MTPLELRQAIERVLGDATSGIGDVIGHYSNGDRAIQSGNRVTENSVTNGIEIVIYPHLIGHPDRIQHYKVSLINHDANFVMDEVLATLQAASDPFITVDSTGARVIPHSQMKSERIDLRFVNGLSGRREDVLN